MSALDSKSLSADSATLSGSVVPYPLSALQQGMVYHAMKDGHSGVDIEQLLLTLPEAVDAFRLEQAWYQVVRRHDVLRTSFEWKANGQPEQIVHHNIRLSFQIEDWLIIGEDERNLRLETLLEADRRTPFDFSSAPLMRFHLVRFGAADFRLLWTFHHVLMDGRSFPIVLKEVFACYDAEANGTSVAFSQAKPYREHIEWLSGRNFEESREFWAGNLKGFDHATPLGFETPFDQQKAPPVRYRERSLSVTETETDNLRAFAASLDVTVNTVFQAAWAVLLSRYSNETDVVFGGTRACRSSSLAGFGDTVGLFINTLPVRAYVIPDRPIASFLRELRATWLAMREHEHTPLNLVKAWTQLPSGSPIFESIVVFENFLLQSRMRNLGERWQERSVAYFGQTNFPITLMGYLDRELHVVLGYDSTRFSDDAIAAMLGHFKTLLVAMSADRNAAVGDLPMLSQAERQKILFDWNSTYVNYESDGLLHRLFEKQADETPHAFAVEFAQERLTYADLDHRANQVAHLLHTLNIGPERLVGVCMERSVEMVVALYGVLKAGAAYVPIDPEYPRDRIKFMVADSGVTVLLTQRRLVADLPEHAARVICLDTDWPAIAREPFSRPEIPIEPDNLAYMIYTSGSTGRPKGALNTHRGICNRLLWMQAEYGLKSTDTVLQKTPFSFDVSVWEFFWPLIFGARLLVAKPGGHREPAYLVETIQKCGVTVLHFVPSMLRVFLAESGVEECRTLRDVICSGEALPYDLQVSFFERLTANLHNLYGPTECAVDVTYWTCERNSALKIVPIGRPIANTQTYILDTRLQPVPVGIPGELHLGGIQVGRGYHNRPELTADKFIRDPFSREPGARLYKTGDLCRFLPDGNIEYLDRMDFQVKIRGLRIELGEIESRLSEHAAVKQAVVIVRTDLPGQKQLVAYLVPSNERLADSAELQKHLLATVPAFMVPAAFVWLPSLPLSPNGKIDRKALPAPQQSSTSLRETFEPPESSTEKILVEIWTKVLRVERIGVNANFFELGGDSILSIQIISLARQAGLHFTPKVLFQNQTVRELARAVQPSLQREVDQALVSGTAPLTPIQRWFFEQRLAEPNYFNQSFVFRLKRSLEIEALLCALNAVELHHDALRTRVLETGRSGQQSFDAPAARASFEHLDYSSVSDSDLNVAITSACTKAQAVLNFEQGPLWHCVYFDLGPNRPARMLLAIHHLAVDGVSWRILLEDLERAYEMASAGMPVVLPAKTTSVKDWATKAGSLIRDGSIPGGAGYWRELAKNPGPRLPVDFPSGLNTEASVENLVLQLSAHETEALLQRAPAAYGTQISDLLLAALTTTLCDWTQTDACDVNLEGHGREELWEGLDLSRTVGWFTTIYPVRLRRTTGGLEAEIKAMKDQLRAVPGRGIGYGLLRYGRFDPVLVEAKGPEVIFNYLGQFDSVVSQSRRFEFSEESTGPWHSPRQHRCHLIEINCMVVRGRLEISWAFSTQMHNRETMGEVANSLVRNLRNIIEHCTAVPAIVRSSSEVCSDRVVAEESKGLQVNASDATGPYPLTPVQALFYAVGSNDARLITDQWHCKLRGPLDVTRLRSAWERVVSRHSILRTSFYVGENGHPLQVVHPTAELSFRVLDWKAKSKGIQSADWQSLLIEEAQLPLKLDRAPLHRFTLVRTTESTSQFLWVVPALLLDGWSWPLVFKDLSQIYSGLENSLDPTLPPVRPYRDYVAWLAGRSSEADEEFWRAALRGFSQPTPLNLGPVGNVPAQTTPEINTWTQVLDETTTSRLITAARRLRVTPSTYVLMAWAVVLARSSGRADVVFGAAFASRPTELLDSENIVGPFSSNLPVRVKIDEQQTADEQLNRLHSSLLAINEHQSASLEEIQSWSEVPTRDRLFDSLVVVQNYAVSDSARKLGDHVMIEDFSGPVHTPFPLLLLIEPGAEWRITLIRDRRKLTADRVSILGSDFSNALAGLVERATEPVSSISAALSAPLPNHLPKPGVRTSSLNYLPPQTELQRAISKVWQEMFQYDRISIEENLFDLGAHSLFVTQLHRKLREALHREFPIVALFQYPTIAALAQHLDQQIDPAKVDLSLRSRAQQQRDALARMRRPGGRK